MKNAFFKKVTIGLLIVLSTAGLSLAGDSASISISCTIPAIPGINVPLITEETKGLGLNNSTAAEKNAVSAGEEINNTTALFQKDTEEIRRLEGKNCLVTLKTIYSR